MTEARLGNGALICIPTYNEKENVPCIVPAVLEEVPEAHILIIDDNSPDGTGEAAEKLAATDDRVHVLHRNAKEGLGRAYIDGFKWGLARGYRKFFEFDADFSHNPVYLPGFMEILEDADVVIGSRRIPGGEVEDWGPLRRLISWGGSKYARMVLGVPVNDLTGGFNGFHDYVLRKLDLDQFQTNGFGFQIEVKYRSSKAGFKVVESPITFPNRLYGESKMSKRIFFEALVNVWRLRFGK